ncbi:MAG: hypothetical protein R2857_07790 [Vampirovibrionales bacterium]
MTGGLMASGLQAQLRQPDARPASKWTLAQFTRYMKDHAAGAYRPVTVAAASGGDRRHGPALVFSQ